MATNTFQSGGVDLNWSTVGNWTLGHAPTSGEDVVIPTGLTAAVDVDTIPATGTLASLTGTGDAQMTIAVNVRGNTSISATTIQAGTKNGGFIVYSGSGTAKTALIVASTITAGTAAAAHAVYITATSLATTIEVDTITGGTNNTAIGVYHNSASGTLTISKTGGTACSIVGATGKGLSWANNAVTTTIVANSTGGTGGSNGINPPATASGATFTGNLIYNGSGTPWLGGMPGTSTVGAITFNSKNFVPQTMYGV